MSEIQVASRYAKSLMDLAEEQNTLEPIRNDIVSFIETLRQNPTLQAVLKNPIISPSRKLNILEELFASRFNPVVLSFFKLLVNKQRSSILYSIAKAFVDEYNIRKNIVKATVTSAAPLSEENKKQIEEVIKETTHGEILLTTKVDPNLIGGFILNVGDKQFDTSLSSQLRKLKKEFEQKAV
ncbi:ATP synthase F1 subunit delta [Daejeonella oryzae]|uniref:ATP synthase F1 subunit delta n=1 Tax=Daejeonella oryzae TaxID=1122943 RepID=UPI000402AC4C|nr:ATP synthase F1 subunit delta [Daejeonella oryzae]